MDAIRWSHQHDEIGLANPSSLITSIPTSSSSAAATTSSRQVAERKARPQKEKALHCPRCNSTNTKFCYYNNYSLTQPRYFCKTCRRYWTEGGSLRNVPVGGGSRKNKRPNSSSTSNTSTSNTSCIEPLQLPLKDTQNPKFSTALQSDLYGLFGNSSTASTSGWSAGGGLDLLMTRNPFAHVQTMEAGQGLGLIRSDAVDDRGCNYGCMQGVMLPLQEMGRVSADDVHVMDMIRGGISGCDSANPPGGVWNW